MYLTDLSDIVSVNIIKDGEFDSLGLLSHDKDKMIVGFYDPNYLDTILENKSISCVITTKELSQKLPFHLGVAVCDDPIIIFYSVHNYLLNKTDFYWKDFVSEISSEANIHEKAYIASKNVRIGPNTKIEPGAIILENTIIEKGVIIRSGAIIGGEGFEPKSLANKKVMVRHAGGVWLHNDVEIQANSHIAKSVFGGFTEIGEESKLDALVHIAHNVRIGRRCEVAACSMIAGSVVIGDDVFIGPNASIASELRIGDGAFITLGSVVTRDVAKNHRVSGNFAVEHTKFISFIKSIR